MSIKHDRSSVPAGSVSFHVANEAISQTHDLIIVALASPGQGCPTTPPRNGSSRARSGISARP